MATLAGTISPVSRQLAPAGLSLGPVEARSMTIAQVEWTGLPATAAVALIGLVAGFLVDSYAARVRRMLSSERAGASAATTGARATSSTSSTNSTSATRGTTAAAVATALTTAALVAAAWRWSPRPWSTVLLVPLLVLVTIIDVEHQLILDGSVLAGLVAGLVLSLWGLSAPILSAVSGLVLGSAVMVVVAMASPGSMGGGDVKFSAVMGVFLGPWFALMALFLGFILAALAGLTLLVTGRKGRKDSIPFGPFLAGGTYIAAVWGPAILRMYLSFVLKK